MNKKQNLSDVKRGKLLHALQCDHHDSLKQLSQLRGVPIQLNLFDVDLGDILFDKVWLKCLPIVQAYRDLLRLDSISDSEADLLEKILTLSEAYPILSKLLSLVDENISLDDGLSIEFEKQAKLKIGDEEYHAWEVRLRC